MKTVSGRSLVFLAETEVDQLKKCSKNISKALRSLNIATLFDLITYYPRRYVDMTLELPIKNAHVGDDVSITGTVRNVIGPKRTKTGKSLVEILIQDDSGFLVLVFFNQPWRTKQLEIDSEVAVFGKIGIYKGYKSMTNPSVEVIGKVEDKKAGKVIPVYPSSEKANLLSRHFSTLIDEILNRSKYFIDPIPSEFLKEHNLLSRDSAIRLIHRPNELQDIEKARRRLAFDELLRVQIPLVKRNIELRQSNLGFRHLNLDPDSSENALGRFIKNLPFSLTSEQLRVIKEIIHDMASPHPMHRLLQGDVGAGKTVVAICAMLTAIESGYQAALMAPTEVLAEQHYLVVKKYLEGYSIYDKNSLTQQRPIKVTLLTSSMTPAKRRILLKRLENKEIDVAIGTHALISSDVKFSNLSLVIIDEQHRFGVEQRFALREKSKDLIADTLVMTATPIPRTAAMVVYGDLELSTIKALPLGRKPIETKWVKSEAEERQAFKLMVDEVRKGHKGYVICPMVDVSENISAKSVLQESERLKSTYLSEVSVGILHGQMPQKEKEQIMKKFKEGDINVLVSTTVVEVGVDISDATVIIILDADRFGIAQLHQLRGRVGRSSLKSYCFLVAENPSSDACERLKALEQSSDGFELAEIDLAIRGEGTLMDLRQQGSSDLKAASFKKDKDLVALARQFAEAMLTKKIEMSPAMINMLFKEVELFIGNEKKNFLFKS